MNQIDLLLTFVHFCIEPLTTNLWWHANHQTVGLQCTKYLYIYICFGPQLTFLSMTFGLSIFKSAIISRLLRIKTQNSFKMWTWFWQYLWLGLFVCSGAYVLTRGSLRASRTLYAQLLSDVLHLPLQYFETNPVGQIISRFTKVRTNFPCQISSLKWWPTCSSL